jgi:hypothetical protein
VDSASDPVALRKFGSAGNRTWNLGICSKELWALYHRNGLTTSNDTFPMRQAISARGVFLKLLHMSTASSTSPGSGAWR